MLNIIRKQMVLVLPGGHKLSGYRPAYLVSGKRSKGVGKVGAQILGKGLRIIFYYTDLQVIGKQSGTFLESKV